MSGGGGGAGVVPPTGRGALFNAEIDLINIGPRPTCRKKHKNLIKQGIMYHPPSVHCRINLVAYATGPALSRAGPVAYYAKVCYESVSFL